MIKRNSSGLFMVQDKTVYLDEANVLGVAAEALPAAHQPILPDQSMRVATDPAANNNKFRSAKIKNKYNE